MSNAITRSWQRIRALFRKELITLLMDPDVRKVLIVPILVQSILFGYGATYNLENVPWTYYDESHSTVAQRIVRQVDANNTFTLTDRPLSQRDFARSIEEQKALVGLYFPSDFATTHQFLLVADARNSTSANVAMGYVVEVIDAINARDYPSAMPRLAVRFLFNENNLTRWNIMPGLILTLSMIQVMLLSGMTVAREREEGSFDMMLMTPTQSFEIFLGKGLPAIFIAIVQGLMIYCVCRFWFQIPFAGQFIDLLAVMLLFSCAIVGVGLALSALARTIQQATVMCFLLVLPSVILSGLMTPVIAMPEWMQTITIINPLRYSMEAVRQIYFEGHSVAEVAHLLWPLILICCTVIPTSLWLFRRKVA